MAIVLFAQTITINAYSFRKFMKLPALRYPSSHRIILNNNVMVLKGSCAFLKHSCCTTSCIFPPSQRLCSDLFVCIQMMQRMYSGNSKKGEKRENVTRFLRGRGSINERKGTIGCSTRKSLLLWVVWYPEIIPPPSCPTHLHSLWVRNSILYSFHPLLESTTYFPGSRSTWGNYLPIEHICKNWKMFNK